MRAAQIYKMLQGGKEKKIESLGRGAAVPHSADTFVDHKNGS